jgi:hypothetical protein
MPLCDDLLMSFYSCDFCFNISKLIVVNHPPNEQRKGSSVIILYRVSKFRWRNENILHRNFDSFHSSKLDDCFLT